MADDILPVDPGRIERAARCLTGLERQVLVLSATSDLSIASVADTLELSCAEAEQVLADALYKLDRALQRQERPWWRFW